MATVADKLNAIATNLKTKLAAINTALANKGQSNATDFDDVVTKVEGILTDGADVSGVTATAADVLNTKKFVTSAGTLTQGTMSTVSHPKPTISRSGSTITASHTQSEGYVSSGGTTTGTSSLSAASLYTSNTNVDTSYSTSQVAIDITAHAATGYSDGSVSYDAEAEIEKTELPTPTLTFDYSTGVATSTATLGTSGYAMTGTRSATSITLGSSSVSGPTFSLDGYTLIATTSFPTGYVSGTSRSNTLSLTNTLGGSSWNSQVSREESQNENGVTFYQYTVSKSSGQIPLVLFLFGVVGSSVVESDDGLNGIFLDLQHKKAVMMNGGVRDGQGDTYSYDINETGDTGIVVEGIESTSTAIIVKFSSEDISPYKTCIPDAVYWSIIYDKFNI